MWYALESPQRSRLDKQYMCLRELPGKKQASGRILARESVVTLLRPYGCPQEFAGTVASFLSDYGAPDWASSAAKSLII